jgi:hypothetical protein
MAHNFGDYDSKATKAINRVAKDSSRLKWTQHSRVEMGNDDFDDTDVLSCLRRGKAHGPEQVGQQWRYNVLHRNLHIRVVVGMSDQTNLATLDQIAVVTVMRIKE